ncbi:hypothetical protein [Haloarcula rubripromontorii]|uniref:hypothetical protein n=1 Tax=Haloarcula rubripromontorii TaxID=1705562 RepID=UPI00345C3A13
MSDDTYTAAQLREILKQGDVDLPALEHAGLIGESELDLLLSIKHHHPRGQDADKYEEVLERAVSHRVRESVENDDLSAMSHAAGLSNSRVDASSFTFTDKVRELFKPDDRDHMMNLVVYAPPPPVGPTGVGKTDFAYSLVEGAEMVHGGDIEISSNNTTDPFDDVQSWTELEAWLEATDGTKVFLWDEAAQVLQYADMSAGKALSQLIKLLRKYNCHLILVAHTGKDIPLDVRRMVLFAEKESKKKATIGAGLEEDSAGHMNVKNVLMRFDGIDATAVEYDSYNDEGSFDFDGDLDPNADTDEKPRCEAETNDGNPCPADAEYPSESPTYCYNHRHLVDDE